MAVNLGTAIAYLTLDVSDFEKGFSNASREMSQFNSEGSTTSSKVQAVGKTMSSVGSTMTKNVTLPILGAAGAVLKTGMDFEYAMSQVEKTVVTKSDYSADAFKRLEEEARKMGKETKFTAVDAANALQYMGMAGWGVNEMLAGLPAVLNMAIAGDTELALTSDIVTDSLTAFGWGADRAGDLCDILAAASMSSNTNVGMLGESFKYAAATSASMGFSVEDTALALGIMANAGIKSTMAGTSLRSVMTNLAKPVGQSAKAMEELGISLNHTDGRAKSFREIMTELRAKLGGINIPTEELNERLASLDEQFQAGIITEEEYNEQVMALTESIYGSENAEKVRLAAMIAGKPGMAGFLALINEGEENFKFFADQIDNSSTAFDGMGAAAKMAEVAQDNVKTDIEKLISALSDLSISIYKLIEGPFGDFIKALTDVIDWFNDLDDGVKQNIVRFLMFMATVGPVLSFLGNLIGIVETVFGAFSKFNGIIKIITGALGMGEGIGLLGILGKVVGFFTGTLIPAIGGVISAIGLLPLAIIAAVAGFALLYAFNDDFREFVNKIVSKAWEWIKEMASVAIEFGEKFVKAIINFIKELPDMIANILKFIIDLIVKWVKDMIEKAEKIFDFVMTVAGIIAELPGKIAKFLADIIKSVIDWGADMLKSGVDAAKNFLKGVIDVVASIPKKFIELLEKVIKGIIDWGKNILKAGVDAAEAFLLGIVNIIKKLPFGIGEHLGGALENIVKWGADILRVGIDAGADFLKNVVGFFAETAVGIIDKLAEGYKAIIDWGADVIKGGIDIAKQFVKGFIDGIAKVVEGVSNVSKKIVDGLKSVGKSLFSVGKDIIGKVADGIKAGVDVVKNAFKSVIDAGIAIIKDPVGSIKNLANYISNPRSAGVSYVPYNNYQAQLHEGEMVLTKQEAEEYRKGTGNNSNGGDTYIFNSPKAIDEREAARLMKQTKRELRLGF